MSLTVDTGVYALEKPKNKTKNGTTATANTGVILAISGSAANVQPKKTKTPEKSKQTSDDKENLWKQVRNESNILKKVGKFFLYCNYLLTNESNYKDSPTALDYIDTDY